jgi:molybdenum cofactor guanylyltransferase
MPRSPAEDGTPQVQPVFCLLRCDLLESLVRFTHEGGRKIDRWTAQHRVTLVDFDDAAAFANANTTHELRRLEAQHGQ